GKAAVDPAEAVERGFHRILDRRGIRDVADAGLNLAGAGLHCRGSGRVLLGVAAPDRDAAATRHKCLRDAEPDTAIAAGDDGHAAGEVEDANKRFLWCFHFAGRVLDVRGAQGHVLVSPWTSLPQKSNMGLDISIRPAVRKMRGSELKRKLCSSSTSP